MADKIVSNDPNAPVGNTRIASVTPRRLITDGQNITITDLRPQIAHEMDSEFVICSVDDFMKAYLPIMPSKKDIDSCIKRLVKAETVSMKDAAGASEGDTNIRRPLLRNAKSKASKQLAQPPIMFRNDREQLRFTEYPDPIIQQDGLEKDIYKHLGTIADAIGAIGSLDDGVHTRNEYNWRNCPDTRIIADISGSNNMIDACFTSGGHTGDLATTQIAVVIEQKRTIDQRLANNHQVVSANVQIMNDDARRMFTFGITFEAEFVTLWYHSRSHSAICEPFSLVENPDLLIKVFMSFLYASKEEMGYDPMVTRNSDDGQFTYTFPQDKGEPLQYRTISTIAAYRSNNITGRMARIWLVSQLDPVTKKPGAQFVLKDVWLDENAATEHELQQAIFQDIDDFWAGKSEASNLEELEDLKEEHKEIIDNKSYKDLFLKIEADYIGKKTKPLANDFKPISGLLSVPKMTKSVSANPVHKSIVSRQGGNDTHSVHTNVQAPYQGDLPRGYARKKQYRIIFNEICQTVGELDTLGEVMDVLHQTLTPLQLMYCAGWVHRDISSGNIFAYRKDLANDKEAWRVKLADLEYAKRYPPPPGYTAATDPKTGTPYFMPHEILLQDGLYNTDLQRPIKPKTRRRKGEFPETVKNEQRIVVHNFQHDLESLWWIVLWTITCRVDHKPSQEWGNTIFQNTMALSRQREGCFIRSIEKKLADLLQPSLHEFCDPMERLRASMCQEHMTRADDLENVGSYAEIHDLFNVFFDKIQGLRSGPWINVPLTKHLPPVIETAPKADSATPDAPVMSPARKRLRSNDDYTEIVGKLVFEPRHSEDAVSSFKRSKIGKK